MQLGDILGVTAAALTMFFVLSILHLGDIKTVVNAKLAGLERDRIESVRYEGSSPALQQRAYPIREIRALAPELQNELLGTNAGFGGAKIPAPQASLMAVVARSIMERKTEWVFILAGVFMGLAFILMQVKSPMLVSVGMYLPIETSFAIFIGGLFKGWVGSLAEKNRWSDGAKQSAENTGTLMASGLIAGEAMIGILFAALAFAGIELFGVFENPSYLFSLVGIAFLGVVLVAAPRARAKAAS
jgi:hypothetical protein